MRKYTFYWGLGLLSGALAGCSLTTTNVEPTVPDGRLNDSSTLVYRANGQLVVTNNAVDLITILVSFLGDPRAVVAKLSADSTLTLRSIDGQSNLPPGTLRHQLRLVIVRFKGAGTYSLAAPALGSYPQATFQLLDTSQAGAPVYYPEQTMVAGPPGQVVVTSWNAATRQLQGTFTLTVAARGTTQLTSITEGRFDADVDK